MSRRDSIDDALCNSGGTSPYAAASQPLPAGAYDFEIFAANNPAANFGRTMTRVAIRAASTKK